MRTTPLFRIVLIAGAVAGAAGCSPAEFLARTLGRAAGNAAGMRIAAAVPVATTVAVDAQGGRFCPTMKQLGWPPEITDDRLNRPLANVVGDTLDHGEKECGWQPPAIP